MRWSRTSRASKSRDCRRHWLSLRGGCAARWRPLRCIAGHAGTCRRASYGYQLAQGATALTEAWDANPANSQDHFMLGDAEEWFYRGLGGINLDLSGRRGAACLASYRLEPNPLARTHYESALGWWRASGGEVSERRCTASQSQPTQRQQSCWQRLRLPRSL